MYKVRFAILALCLSALGAYGAEPDSDGLCTMDPAGLNRSADFCRDPYAAICGASDEIAELRRSRVERFRAASRPEACEPSEKEQSRAAYYAEVLPEVLDDVRAGVMHEGLPRSLRDLMVGEFKNITFVTSSFWNSGLDTLGNDPDELKRFYDGYVKYCGEDGLRDSAFSFRRRKAKVLGLYVVICPGWFVASGPNSRGPILQVTAHEIGHLINTAHTARVTPAFRRWSACLRKVHGDDWDFQYLNEGAADYWAVRATASSLRELGTFSIDEKLGVLREAWSGLCGAPRVSKEYPSGRFRIEKLLRLDPEIHSLMNCGGALPPGAGPYGCALGGRSKLVN